MPVGEGSGREPRRAKGRDYQVELGTTGLLALFCSLAVMCGVFFAFGYTLGKHAIPATFSLGSNDNNGGPSTGLDKPAPGTPQPVPVIPTPAANSEVQPPNPADLTAAEDSAPSSSLQPGAGTDAGSAAGTAAPDATLKPAKPKAAKPGSPSPGNAATTSASALPADGARASGSGSYSVQVFAGTKEGDAKALAAALKGKQYSVFILRPGQVNGDQLYRVQVGPFASVTEAEATRSHLTADGYTAILKH